MDLNQWDYESYINLLQNKPPPPNGPTGDSSQNPNYFMYPPPLQENAELPMAKSRR